MTFNEFKAWLEGFSTGIYDNPTIGQWRVIEEKIKEVDMPPPIPLTPHLPSYPANAGLYWGTYSG